MMKRNNTFLLGTLLSLLLTAALFSGCATASTVSTSAVSVPPTSSAVTSSESLPDTGVLYLRVNPEIAIHYDANGIVTAVEGVNDDGKALLTDAKAYVGQECRTAVQNLVAQIYEAGYFVEEVDGGNRQIVIEVERGSVMPSDQFLGDIVTDVRSYVNTMHLSSDIDLEGESNYRDQSINRADDTDYGPYADGVTDYNDTDYGPYADGVTDYNDTDYGPYADGVTDYNDTDYGPYADGVTDYNDTDYGPNADGVTDYNDTDYGPNADGVTDYGATNYNSSNYGRTNYDDYGTTNYGASNYGDTNYDDGGSDYSDHDDD